MYLQAESHFQAGLGDTTGVFPGSFNPPTVAHLSMATTAVERFGLSRLDLTVSRRALGKDDVEHPRFEDRMAVLADSVADHPKLECRATDQRLLADIAQGYDLVVLGADKWHQISEPHWYEGGEQGRDRALARLPAVVVFHRAGQPHPAHSTNPAGVDLTVIDHDLSEVSSTRARSGELELMTEAAQQFALKTGAWSEPT